MSAIKVYLRAFEPEDFRKINLWRHDDDMYRLTTGNRYFVSSERDREWVLEKIKSNQNEVYVAICLVENDLMIGYASLSAIDYRNSRAEWSGIVIGEKEYRGQGYASQALFLLLEYAFDELGLYRVSGIWIPSNKVSICVAKMMGFRQEGLLRDYVYKSGKRHDLIVMSMLRHEFDKLRTRYLGTE
jgi:RimJ/RimL family protein N-acetyltransferase